MNVYDFEYVVKDQLQKCQNTLIEKGKEYATEDVLHNFRQAAHLKQTTLKDVLSGKMVKHTVSIYDMCGSDEPFTMAQWEEKIGDHINYLLLLKGVLVEEAEGISPEKDEPLPYDFSQEVKGDVS